MPLEPLENLGGPSSNPSSETHDLIAPLGGNPNNLPSLEAFLLLDDSSNGSAPASVVPSSRRWPIRSSPNGCSLVDDIAKELRSFRGLITLQRIFWELLGYERIGEPLPLRTFSDDVRHSILEATILGRHEGIYVLTVRLSDRRFTGIWRNTILSQARHWFATAIVLFSDFGWSRAALGWRGERDARLLKPLRLWPLAKADRIPLAEKLASLRAFDDEDSPRGTLDLAESICRLGEQGEEEAFPPSFQEPSVDPDLLYDRLFQQCPLMRQEETQGLIRTLAVVRLEERMGVRNERYRELRDRLICGHVRLCARVIKHFGLLRKCHSLTWADLMQEGIFGLARAIDRFDVNRGTRFSTYAFPWIRQAINRAIENKDRVIRIPTHYWRGELQLPEWVVARHAA